MPIGSKRCRPTNTTARWPRPSRLSANSISPNSRAWRPHAASDATDLPATNAQDKPTSRSERFPDAWPHHRRYPARGSPPGAHRYPPRYAPPAARRARRYARVPPMDSGDEPLPMIKKDHADWGAFSAPIDNFNLSLGVDYFWTPIMAYFSAPIDIGSHLPDARPCRVTSGSDVLRTKRFDGLYQSVRRNAKQPGIGLAGLYSPACGKGVGVRASPAPLTPPPRKRKTPCRSCGRDSRRRTSA